MNAFNREKVRKELIGLKFVDAIRSKWTKESNNKINFIAARPNSVQSIKRMKKIVFYKKNIFLSF